MTESAREPKKRFWVTLLRPKVAIPLGLFVLLLLSPVLYRGWNLGHVPDLGDPFPAELLKNPALSDEDNAWVNYKRAEELRSFPDLESVIFPSVSRPRISGMWGSLADVERIKIWDTGLPSGKDADKKMSRLNLWIEALRDNNDALVEWKAGTEKTKHMILDNSVETLEASDYSMTFYPKLASLDSQALAKAGQLASQEKHAEALDWMLAVYRYSRHLTQSGGTENWERAIEISQRVFQALDDLLDDEVCTHADLIDFLHKLERAHDLTGDFELALVDDYLALKQQILNAHNLATKYREEVEAGSSAPRNNRFELYVEGEPQLSLRFLQHHFEYLKRNLEKPVGDRVLPITVASWGGSGMHELTQLYRENPVSIETAMSADQMEAFVERVGLLREVVGLSDLFTNPFLREDDAMLFESLRILVAAHALARRSPFKTNWDPRLLDQLNTGEQFQIEALPVVTMEELVSDSLIETPHDPYHPSLPLIIATQRNGEVFIFSSTSVKYDHLANGEPLESIEQSDHWYLSLVYKPTFIEEPQFRYLTFHLPIDSDDQARLTE